MKAAHFSSAPLPPQMTQELPPQLRSALIHAISIASTDLAGIRHIVYLRTGQKLSRQLIKCWNQCISSTAFGCALYSGSDLSEMAKNSALRDSRIPPDCKQIDILRHVDTAQNLPTNTPADDNSKNAPPNNPQVPFPPAFLQNTALGFALSRLLRQKQHLQSMSEDNNNCINCILSHLVHDGILPDTDIQSVHR